MKFFLPHFFFGLSLSYIIKLIHQIIKLLYNFKEIEKCINSLWKYRPGNVLRKKPIS